MFSVSGLMGICTTKMWKSFATTLIAAHVSRIVQAVFQCCLICIASKLKHCMFLCVKDNNVVKRSKNAMYEIAKNLLEVDEVMQAGMSNLKHQPQQ
uniref:Uncharacterized protein n=1 Tax=Panagrolaimus davidi TaxID=227884 RepID=A0A914QFJ2_9BILA